MMSLFVDAVLLTALGTREVVCCVGTVNLGAIFISVMDLLTLLKDKKRNHSRVLLREFVLNGVNVSHLSCIKHSRHQRNIILNLDLHRQSVSHC